MAIDHEAAAHLKPWLVRTLEPMSVPLFCRLHLYAHSSFLSRSCDAEPGALGEYILALLKHNAPEGDLRQELSAQLEEFLEKGASDLNSVLICML